MYVRRPALAGGPLAASVPGLYRAVAATSSTSTSCTRRSSSGRWTGWPTFCRVFDQYVVDGLVDLVGQMPRLFGVLFRPVQNGLVQFYALAMVLGLAVFLLALVLR